MKKCLFLLFVLLVFNLKAQNNKVSVSFNFTKIQDFSDQHFEYSFSPVLGLEAQLVRRSKSIKYFFDYGILLGYNRMKFNGVSINGAYDNQIFLWDFVKIGVPISYSVRLFNNKHGSFDLGLKLTTSVLLAKNNQVQVEIRPTLIGSYGIRSKLRKLESSIDIELGVARYLQFTQSINFCALIGYGRWF